MGRAHSGGTAFVILLLLAFASSLPLFLHQAIADDTLVVATASTSSNSVKKAYTTQTTKMNVKTVSGRTIANGDYIISSADDAQLVVGVRKASVNDGVFASLQKENARFAKSQTWTFNYVRSMGTYTVVNKKSGKALTAKNGAANGSSVVQSSISGNGSSNQRWYVTATKSGYKLLSAANGNVSLSVGAATAKNGAIMQVANSKVSKQQRFWLYSAKDWSASTSVIKSGVYTIKSAAASAPLLLCAPGGVTRPGTQYGISANGSKLSQMFRITAVHKPAGYYTLQNVGSSLYVTAVNGKARQKALSAKMRKGQLWKPVATKSGVVFKSRSGYTLSLAKDSAKKNAKVVAVKAKNLVTDEWVISPTTVGLGYTLQRALDVANIHGTRVGYRKSKTVQKYYITADLSTFDFYIFKRTDAYRQWVPFKHGTVACGRNNSTREGHYCINRKNKYRGDDEGYRAWYWSWIGGGRAFHSVICLPYSSVVTDSRTTGYISNGCIRMSLDNARYIYEKMPLGTFVSRYY